MERLKAVLKIGPAYEPVRDERPDGDGELNASVTDSDGPRFSFVAYFVFVWIGIAMLWAWNMFLAAAPYLQYRFRSSKPILSNFQASELAVSTFANLGSMIVLSNLQRGASYPRRIVLSLSINIVTFSLLAVSTKSFLDVSAGGYFGFIIVMIFCSSLATGFLQNGTFAYSAAFKNPVYIQGVMLGQGIAGVLPPIVQIVSVLSASTTQRNASTSAFAYFLTATGVSCFTLVAFWLLDTNYRPVRTEVAEDVIDSPSMAPDHDDSAFDRPASATTEDDALPKKKVPLLYLFRRLFFHATAVFLTFGITMTFPVFTQRITSTNPGDSPLLQDAAFIPLALLIWNIGDLFGRLIPAIPKLSLASRPRLLLAFAIARVVFIPLYLVCNIQSPSGTPSTLNLGATLPDAFYLIVVQFPFGLTNGYLGTCCMSGAGNFVEDDEREATGAFMSLMLVSGLAVGSVCSFFVGNS